MDEPIWDATTFTKNRDRLLEGDIATAFFAEVLAEAKARRPGVGRAFHRRRHAAGGVGQSEEFPPHASAPPDTPDDPGNPTVNFRGEARKNDTHQSTTDPDARLFKKTTGSEAKLAYLGHVLMENRHGLIVDALVTPATGTAERDAALTMLGELPHGGRRHRRRRQELRHARLCAPDVAQMNVTPHVAQYPDTDGAAARSTAARRGIPVTRSANASGSSSRKPSAG